MWEAFPRVETGIALLAFAVAVFALIHRNHILSDERRIRSAPEGERAALVARHLEFFNVDTTQLTREQATAIAIRQIDARAKRFLVVAWVVMFVFFVMAAVAFYSIARQVNEVPLDGSEGIAPAPSSASPPPGAAGSAGGTATPPRSTGPRAAYDEPTTTDAPASVARLESLVSLARSMSELPADDVCRRYQYVLAELPKHLRERLDSALLRRADLAYQDAKSEDDFAIAAQLYDSALQRIFPY